MRSRKNKGKKTKPLFSDRIGFSAKTDPFRKKRHMQ